MLQNEGTISARGASKGATLHQPITRRGGRPPRCERIIMRQSCLWLAAIAFLAAAAPASAEEPHLEMIRGLRAAGEPELAIQYIEEQLPKNLPPQLAQVIALELARTRVEVARAEGEEGKRLALFAAARAEFEKFLAANPKHELAPQARFEIARLVAAQGKELVNRSRRVEGEAKTRMLKDAAKQFEAAGVQLKEAAKLLGDQLKELGDPQTPQQKTLARDLTQSWLLAQFEEGQNLYQRAQTFVTAEEVKTRGGLITDAGKAFQKLATQVPQHPLCWLARAWLARCYFENQDFPKATEQLDLVRAERGPYADEAHRVADYFRVLMARAEGTTAPMTLGQQQTALQGWLERYRSYQHTPEGCGARYTLADVLEREAYAIKGGVETDGKGRPTKVTAEAAALLKAAERHLRFLTEFENDFSERAATKRMRLILAIAIRETPDRDPAKLTTFENCYLLALLEVAELQEALKDPMAADDPDKAAELVKKHYQRAVRALDRAMRLVQPSDPAKEVQDARVMQVFASLKAGNPHEAAILGEYLAKQMIRSSRGAIPALYSLQGYRQVMLDTKAAGAAKEAELQTDREQVRRMASFMETTWPNDTPTDTARHLLGALYAGEGDYVKSLETYARVTPNYVGLARLRNEQGLACFNLQKDTKVPAPVRKQWFDRITNELERLPDLGRGAEPEVAYAYCLAKLVLGDLLLQEGKQYPRAEELGKHIMAQSATYTLGDKALEVKSNAQALMLYGLYGRVYEQVKAHNNTEAAKLYQPVLAELSKNPPPEDEAAARARKAAADFLQLALRSTIQEGDIDRAQEMLKQLQQIGTGKGNNNTGGPLISVLKEVQAQISDMRKTDPNRLKDTIDKLTSFLEALAKQPKLGRDEKILLAQGFSSVDKPGRALELLTSIEAPKEKDPGPPPKPPADGAADSGYEDAKTKYDTAKSAYDAAWRPYWFAQLTQVRVLRQAGRLAENAAERNKHFGEAEKLLDEMVGTGQKPGWAFNTLEVRREKIFLLEDREKWQDALNAWVAMQKPFSKFSDPPKDERETRIRAAYYEVRFYQTRLVYKSKLKLKDQKKKEAGIKKLAEQVVEMEKDARTSDFGGAGVRKLFVEWLADEPEMRKAYEAAGGKALLPSGDTAGAQ
jgi:hypothetical protein